MSDDSGMVRQRPGTRTRSAKIRLPASILLVVGWLGHVWTLALMAVVATFAVVAVRSTVPETPFVSTPIVLMAILGMLFLTAALRVRIEPAVGIRVARNLAPTLHEVIDSLSERLHVPRYRDVLLGTGMEIRTVSVPRLGGLRGFNDYLLIGLPVMLALPLDHLRALLAHELAHRSRSRAVRGARVHRLRDGWLQAARSVTESRHIAVLPLKPFFRWFARWFGQLAFDAARSHELAADRKAAQLTSRNALAGALLRLEVVDRFMVERFHPRLLADLRQFGIPPAGLDKRFERELAGLRTDPRFHAWIDEAIQRGAADRDTHPALRRRLSALALGDLRKASHRGVIEAAFSGGTNEDSAARVCLAALPNAVMVTIEKVWIDEVQRGLATRHEELVRLDERRKELEGRPELSPHESLDHAIATAETEGIDAALPELRKLVSERPDMAPARFVLGTLLLRNNNPQGLAHIHAAARLDPELDEPGRELAAAFLRANEREIESIEHVDGVEPPPLDLGGGPGGLHQESAAGGSAR